MMTTPAHAATDQVIRLEDIRKTFGRTVALDDLNLEVPQGQIRGFLGPNGAGTSTTRRGLLGTVRADSGTARLFGADPWRDAASLHRRLAYVPGDVNLWPNLTGGEAIDLLGRSRGGIDPKRRDSLIERFDLDPRKRCRAYSKGNRQKVALVSALASDVELLLLDEPTSGLDPLMERQFTEVIREQQDAGRTVLLSSHILSEVEELCDHVSIIRAGRIVESGTLAQLRHLHRTSVAADLDDPSRLTGLPGTHDPRVEGASVRVDVDDDAMPAVLRALADAGARGRHRHSAEPRGTVPQPLRRRGGVGIRHGRPAAGRGHPMTGLGVLGRLYWRQNKVFYLAWIVVLGSFLPLTALKYHDLVPAGDAGAAMVAGLAANPTMKAILGLPFDLSTAGGFTFWRVGGFTAAAAGIMAGLGVVRSTRDEEEAGRLELIRAGSVDRHAPLAAALAVSMVACLILGVVVAASMIGARTPLAGSIAGGLGIALTGAMFAALAGVVAQVFESARTTRAWTMGILGGLYVVRALIDASGDASVVRWGWAMPLDWAAYARPYSDERWWVLLLPVAVTLALTFLAFALESRRDLGGALVGERPGPAVAPPSLSGAWGLSLRLHRGDVLGWGLGISVSALFMGSLSLTVDRLYQNQPSVAKLLQELGSGTSELVIAFQTTMLGIMTTIISLAGVSMVGRLRTEETEGRAEAMLATAISRRRLLASHVVPALALTGLLLVLTGVLVPMWQAIHDGSGHLPWQIFQASAAFLPGMILVVGLATAMIGLFPRGMWVAWALVGWTVLTTWLLPLVDAPTWLIRLQPWGHLPHLPTDPMTWTPVLIESAIGVALLVAGFVGYRTRDVGGR